MTISICCLAHQIVLVIKIHKINIFYACYGLFIYLIPERVFWGISLLKGCKSNQDLFVL